jgi:hypothetical protein
MKLKLFARHTPTKSKRFVKPKGRFVMQVLPKWKLQLLIRQQLQRIPQAAPLAVPDLRLEPCQVTAMKVRGPVAANVLVVERGGVAGRVLAVAKVRAVNIQAR